MIGDHVREADGAWFSRNPGDPLRVRLLVPGETPYPIPSQFTHMAVLRLGADIAFKVAIDSDTAARLRSIRTAVAA